MGPKHRIVISAENNAYMAWQAKLIFFSCVTRLQLQPLIVVHETGGPWDAQFYDLKRAGAVLISAPSYAQRGARSGNTAGTLLQAAEICPVNEFIVLCDPDMIFVRGIVFPETLAAQHYSYMHYRWAEVEEVAQRLGMSPPSLHAREPQLCCGVPYVIPALAARPLALRWLEILGMFPQREPRWMWMDVMYAFGLAVADLGLDVLLLDIVDQNHSSDQLLRHDVIHYCMGDATWDKRQFADDQQVARWATSAQPAKGSVLEEIVLQLREAGRFYRDYIQVIGKGP